MRQASGTHVGFWHSPTVASWCYGKIGPEADEGACGNLDPVRTKLLAITRYCEISTCHDLAKWMQLNKENHASPLNDHVPIRKEGLGRGA